MISKQSLGNKIRSLREYEKISQENLAQKIKLSRVAISQIEQGNRSVDFLELAKIAKVFKLKTDYFLIEDELLNLKPINKRNKINNFNAKKLKNVILYILEKCAGKPNLGETVLCKLLYFIDFDNFEINNKSITGLDYIHLQYGPVPIAQLYLPVIEAMKNKKELKIIISNYFGLRIKRYINLIEHDINSLQFKEIKTIDSVINTLSSMSALQIEEYSHGDAPWQLTNNKEIIPYHLVFKRRVPYAKKVSDNLRYFEKTSAKDILNELGSISKSEHDYYENI